MGSNATDPQPPRSKQLAAGPRTSAEARWFLWEALRNQDVMTNDLYDASLLTTEIASNAARHGREPIKVNVSLEEDGLRVSVDDQGSGFDPTDETTRGKGWGVKLVEALSSDWGVEPRHDGTEVWFKIQ
jgi:anti-sigma regulatory factor (Ser/Thr protein kinase)